MLAYAHTTPAAPAFTALEAATRLAHLPSDRVIGPIAGKLLSMLASLSRASRSLVLGGYTGYAALALADGMGGGEVVCVEGDGRAREVARECLRGVNGVRIVAGAGEVGGVFDVVFVGRGSLGDGEVLEWVRWVGDRGVLVVDCALGGVLWEEGEGAEVVRRILERVREDEELERVLLTVREGMLVVRRTAR